MGTFKDLMSQPLPSKLSSNDESLFMESELDDIDDDQLNNDDEIDLDDVVDDIPDDVSELEDEIANVSDDELDDMEASVHDEDDEDDDDDIEGSDDDDEDEATLSDDEEIEADKFMSLVATPAVLKNELTEEECKDFAESVDLEIAIDEGFFLESDNDGSIFESDGDFDFDDMLTLEAAKFAPKTKVVFSEKDRKKQLFEVGVAASARAHGDRDYMKLQKCYRLERILKAKLRKKYKAEALKRVKAYILRLKKSKSGILSKIADKITGKQ